MTDPTSPGTNDNHADQTTPGTATAVLYLRVSTKEQADKGTAEGYSIPTQRLAGHQKAIALGADVVHEFVDAGESARSADRPELQRMLAFLETATVDYLIVHKVDRLARNRGDDLMITLALERAGVQLVSCSENIDNRTPSGKLTHGLMALIAEWYSSNLSTEVKAKTLEKVRQGGTPFKAPVGYLNVRRVDEGRETRTVELDPERAAHVRWAFEAYATGEWSVRRLTAALADRGLTTVASKHYARKPLPMASVNRLLRNRYYVGKIVWRDVEYDGTHPRLISDELFTQVQAVLEAHRLSGEKQRVHQHYLKGSVWCGSCGSRLIVSVATNRHGVSYPYFLCIGRHQKRTACRQRAIPIELVEQLVAEHWKTVELDPDYADAVERAVHEELAKSQGTLNRERARATRRRQQLTEERSKLLQAHYADAIPLDLLKQEQARIQRELELTEARLEASNVTIEVVENGVRASLGLLRDCARFYASSPPRLRRSLNQAVFQRLFIVEDGVVGHELEEPFQLLLEPDLLTSSSEEAEERSDVRTSHDVGRQSRPEQLPEWLDPSAWWAPAERTDHGPFAGRRRDRRQQGLKETCLKELHLVPPAGLEPATPAF